MGTYRQEGGLATKRSEKVGQYVLINHSLPHPSPKMKSFHGQPCSMAGPKAYQIPDVVLFRQVITPCEF